MHSPQTRVNIEHCRSVLEGADLSDEMRQLASNFLNHLMEMHDAQRLRIPVFLLALDSLELVPGLEDCVRNMRATATREQSSND